MRNVVTTVAVVAVIAVVGAVYYAWKSWRLREGARRVLRAWYAEAHSYPCPEGCGASVALTEGIDECYGCGWVEGY